MKDIRLTRHNSLLLIVDVQQRLVPAVRSSNAEELIPNIMTLIQAADLFGVPIVTTEQYPQGLGPTVPELAALLKGRAGLPKLSFSGVRDDGIRKDIEQHNRKQIILCGIEAHVCVLQTALDLMLEGYGVHVISDAVGSRTENNRLVGLSMIQAGGGILSSTETAAFQWAEQAGSDAFKALSRLVR